MCSTCLPELCEMSEIQSFNTVKSLLCHHSKVAGCVIRDFSNPYYLDGWLSLEDDEEMCHIFHVKEDGSTRTRVGDEIFRIFLKGSGPPPPKKVVFFSETRPF